jgi:flagellar protein FliO/FliZ
MLWLLGSGVAWAASPSAASDSVEGGSWLFASLGTVLVIVATGWAALQFLRQRRQGGGATIEELKVIGATALGAQQRAVMLRVGDRVFLLGVTPQHVTLLSELDAPSGASPASADTSA